MNIIYIIFNWLNKKIKLLFKDFMDYKLNNYNYNIIVFIIINYLSVLTDQ